MTPNEVAELLSRPTITPAELIASGILPLKRNGVYDAIKRGKIQVIDLGHRKAVVSASLRRMLGLEP
ncbi:hypothetical protein M2171_005580 [Bradyrhizobium japonicum USDA 38]|uniref:hypothetical protein n=1 Tax=Bradyrhizobium japonicum TaxID=375 RepID=UPI0003FB89A5|nr:hypothetical protein [Bradyrhizobium japonicum]MCS3896447.1 hypothetical protein [Bradyrhizobium japonicum USDA 38]MCS3948962.1 hypothetical protein [Bradyrhizobium japonicum]